MCWVRRVEYWRRSRSASVYIVIVPHVSTSLTAAADAWPRRGVVSAWSVRDVVRQRGDMRCPRWRRLRRMGRAGITGRILKQALEIPDHYGTIARGSCASGGRSRQVPSIDTGRRDVYTGACVVLMGDCAKRAASRVVRGHRPPDGCGWFGSDDSWQTKRRSSSSMTMRSSAKSRACCSRVTATRCVRPRAGRVGIDAAREFDPDLIVLDIMMESPVEGYTVVHALHAQAGRPATTTQSPGERPPAAIKETTQW